MAPSCPFQVHIASLGKCVGAQVTLVLRDDIVPKEATCQRAKATVECSLKKRSAHDFDRLLHAPETYRGCVESNLQPSCASINVITPRASPCRPVKLDWERFESLGSDESQDRVGHKILYA
jgi:hypothetical protein